MRKIRIGSGVGYSGDRIEPAIELAEKGGIDYLVFECLGERTIALAQQARMKDPRGGYDPLLAARMRAVLPICHAPHCHQYGRGKPRRCRGSDARHRAGAWFER